MSCSGGSPGGSTPPAGCGGPLRTSIQVLGSDAYQLFNTSVIAATDCNFLTAEQTQDRWTWTVPAEVKSLEVGTAGVTLPLQRVAS